MSSCMIIPKAKINDFCSMQCRHLRDCSVQKKLKSIASLYWTFFYFSYPLEYIKELKNLSKFLIGKLIVTIRVWLSHVVTPQALLFMTHNELKFEKMCNLGTPYCLSQYFSKTFRMKWPEGSCGAKKKS